MTLRVLHLSDPHFGTEQPAAVDALVTFAHAQRPHAVIVSGDLTQRATAAQFDACAAFLARLPAVPQLLIPGNHDLPLYDLPARLFAPYARYRRFLTGLAAAVGRDGDAGSRTGDDGRDAPGSADSRSAGSGGHRSDARIDGDGDARCDGVRRRPEADADAALEPVLVLPGLTAIGVDTTRRWRQQNGALSARQIDRVAARLRAAPAGHWRLAVTHHPLAVLRDADRADRPLGHALARRRWAEAGADLLLSGHVHVPAVLPVAGDARVVGAGTAVSSRLAPGYPNSVNVLVQEAGDGDSRAPRRRVERHDFNARSGRFEPAAVEVLSP